MTYKLSDLKLGESSQYGHTVYQNALYSPPSSNAPPKKVIFKKNKFGRADLSLLELAFSKLANLFLDKNLTSPQHITLSQNEVEGLCTEHLCYVIANKVGINKAFYTLKQPYKARNFFPKRITKVEDIPYYFLNNLPHGYFASLLKAEKEKRIKIDYASLASILATAYTLEEDDLHKGNFGFYITEKDQKPYVTFFKIDHDLMFVNSIMSFTTQRLFHFFDGSHAFDIKAADLINFPQLTYSSNSYWPTRFALYKPWDSKGYRYKEEINAFASLQYNPDFIKAKWMCLYKHILMPVQKIKQTLNSDLTLQNAKNNLILQATVARLAQLKAVLFSIKEFRDFVGALDFEEQEALLNQLIEPSDGKELANEIRESLHNYHKLCLSNTFDDKDTPLHMAIKLGDYRYEESMHDFKEFLHVKNSAGKTPLDVALDLFYKPQSNNKDIRKNLPCTILHLIEHGARTNRVFNLKGLASSTYAPDNEQLQLAGQASSYAQLKSVLKTIGEDSSYSLKSKKILTVACIKEFIKNNKGNSNLTAILNQLQREMTGKASPKACADLLYIRQLRSKLWIIRQIRGLYGRTSTQSEIEALVQQGLREAALEKPKTLHKLPSTSFFHSRVAEESYLEERPSNRLAAAAG